MTQPLHQLLDRVVFAYDFERVFSSGGVKFMYDHGPHGFHMQFPGGGADPTEQLDGSYYFDGGDYLILPASELARFYARMPTREHTWILSADNRISYATVYAFSCWLNAGGLNYGLALPRSSGTVAMVAYQMQGTAPFPYVTPGAGSCPNDRRRTTSISLETTPRSVVEGIASAATAWAGGAFGTAVYSVVTQPRIGIHTTGAGGWLGKMWYLALVSGAVDLPTQLSIQRWISAGRKPWCEGVFG